MNQTVYIISLVLCIALDQFLRHLDRRANKERIETLEARCRGFELAISDLQYELEFDNNDICDLNNKVFHGIDPEELPEVSVTVSDDQDTTEVKS